MENIIPNPAIVNYKRKYKIGTRLYMPSGALYRYVKVDMGSLGKINGKPTRAIVYMWAAINVTACSEKLRQNNIIL